MIKLRTLISKSKILRRLSKKIANAYVKNEYDISIQEIDNLYRYRNYKLCEFFIDDIDLKFIDLKESNTIEIVKSELESSSVYDFKNIDFKEGDCVIDIGANIGMVSIYLAKRYPFLKIYAYEPVMQNYQNLLTNIKLNNIPDGTIYPYNAAVTKDGRNVNMSINVHNYGGSSISDVISVGATTQTCNMQIESKTLEDIMNENGIDSIKLLKIDCEGSEYEILYNAPEGVLRGIKILRGEFHENKKLTDEYDVDALLEYTKKYVNDIEIEPARECFVM